MVGTIHGMTLGIMVMDGLITVVSTLGMILGIMEVVGIITIMEADIMVVVATTAVDIMVVDIMVDAIQLMDAEGRTTIMEKEEIQA